MTEPLLSSFDQPRDRSTSGGISFQPFQLRQRGWRKGDRDVRVSFGHVLRRTPHSGGLAHEKMLSGDVAAATARQEAYCVAVGPAISDGAGVFAHPGLCCSGVVVSVLQSHPLRAVLLAVFARLLVFDEAADAAMAQFTPVIDERLGYVIETLTVLDDLPATVIGMCGYDFEGREDSESFGHRFAFLTGRDACLRPDALSIRAESHIVNRLSARIENNLRGAIQ